MAKPRIQHLEPEVADAITHWVDTLGENYGLWIWGPPRVGTTYAGYAALTEMGRLPAYAGGEAQIRACFDVYEDLRSIWDASTYSRGNASDSAGWDYRDQIDAEVTALWAVPVFMLNDWSETVPVEFFTKHFHPLIRRRITSCKPTLIISYFDPSVMGGQERYYREEFVVAEVTRRGNGTG